MADKQNPKVETALEIERDKDGKPLVRLFVLITGERVISCVLKQNAEMTAMQLFRPCVFGTIFDKKSGETRNAMNYWVGEAPLDTSVMLFPQNTIAMATPTNQLIDIYIHDFLTVKKEELEAVGKKKPKPANDDSKKGKTPPKGSGSSFEV